MKHYFSKLFSKLQEIWQYIRNYCKRHKRTIIKITAVILLLTILKIVTLSWRSREFGSFDKEKSDILRRREWLLSKVATSPREVIDAMPASLGSQYQGEWALYSCSMTAASLVNISKLYPETQAENICHIERLIDIVASPEIREYDRLRWGEDPLTTLDGEYSHISYLSHLAWMICGYKTIGGAEKYDTLLSNLCEAMNRRIIASDALNLPTYPGEPIYIPDMLVAIVALKQYGDLYSGEYRTTVAKWLESAKSDWIDANTGLLVSFLDDSGEKFPYAPIKGSYSALSCYYLTLVDKSFARQQYLQLKQLFWKKGAVKGLREYWNKRYFLGLGMDVDAGPIMFGLSPSGTAFFTGAVTFFGDGEVRNGILRTAELAGTTVDFGGKRHYLLANITLVGEAILLAMRTNV